MLSGVSISEILLVKKNLEYSTKMEILLETNNSNLYIF